MRWKIDTHRSHIDFEVKKFVLQKLCGRFTDFEGEIDFNPAHPHHSTIQINIDPRSFTTDVAERNIASRRRFFNITTSILFESERIHLRDESTAQVSGRLTINHITHPISFDVEFLGQMDDAMQFRGMAHLNRKDFNIRWHKMPEPPGMNLLFDETVVISLHIQAVPVPEFAWT